MAATKARGKKARATTPPLRGTPPREGNQRVACGTFHYGNSPPLEGWPAQLDGVVLLLTHLPS